MIRKWTTLRWQTVYFTHDSIGVTLVIQVFQIQIGQTCSFCCSEGKAMRDLWRATLCGIPHVHWCQSWCHIYMPGDPGKESSNLGLRRRCKVHISTNGGSKLSEKWSCFHQGLVNVIKVHLKMISHVFLVCDMHRQLLWWNIVVGNFTPTQNLLLTIGLFCDELLVINKHISRMMFLLWMHCAKSYRPFGCL